MHSSVPDEFKPVAFENGIRVAFPQPSRELVSPDEVSAPQVESASNQNQQWRGPNNRHAPRTTLMLRNLPNDYTRAMLLQLLDTQGYLGHYDFVYLPMDFKTGCSLGYAFINMVTPEDAERLMKHFTGFSNWAMPSRKVAEVTWSSPNQGLAVHIDRYRNSNIMHSSVSDDFKPVLFQQGVRVPFPNPTRAIKDPPQGA